MAADTRPCALFPQRFLGLAIAALPALGSAQATNDPAQQWRCQPRGTQWDCQPLEHTAAVSATTPETARDRWDWVSKSQLADPSLCDTGCDGVYLAPPAEWPEAQQAPEHSPLRASADDAHLVDNIATMTGGVTATQGSRRLSADRASLDRNTQVLTADGRITLREPGLLVRADSARFNLDTTLGAFRQAQFVFHDQQLRGDADAVQRQGEQTLDLESARLTRCAPGDEVWTLHAGHIHLDREEGWGSAKHARLNIHDVPVVYLPYMTFPIDERRKSGFLWPSFASGNDNGFEFTAPYYFNLAPNLDATVAPRYIEKRGTMAEMELRHLSRFGQWVFSGAHLEDDLYRDNAPADDDEVPPQQKRWVGDVDHRGGIGRLRTSVDYTRVSDEDFFRDLSTDSLELKRTYHLPQQAAVSYGGELWNTKVLARQYQTIDEDLTEQYKMLPRATLERQGSGTNFAPTWSAEAEFTRFDHDQSFDEGGRFTTGDRAYGELGVSYPMRWAAGFITPSAKVRSISYDLDATAADADTTPTATVPSGAIDMGLIFERDAGSYLQTLEPRLYYLYSDFEAQADNPDFDTRELDFSYSQLFRDTRFAGHDRLGDANRLSIGVTSRFIDNTEGREWLSLSLGQIFYFEDRRVHIGGITPEDRFSNSDIATEVQYQPANRLWLTQTLLWDSRRNLVDEGGLSLHYQAGADSLYNVSYRFRRDGTRSPIDGIRDLSQADASMVLPVGERWSVYARYRYDVDEHRAVDDLVGVRYEDCCWAVSLIYQRSFDEEFLDPVTGRPVLERDHTFVLEFQLKGLGNLGNTARNLLIENILGYEELEP